MKLLHCLVIGYCFQTVARGATVPELQRALWIDVLKKLNQGQQLTEICPDLGKATNALDAIARHLPIFASSTHEVLATVQSACMGVEDDAKVAKVTDWIRLKYGMLDLPVLIPFDVNRHGSYESPSPPFFRPVSDRLANEPLQPLSMGDLREYLERKWGGLSEHFEAPQVVFSELGTKDSAKAFKEMGFGEIYLVNGTYANRGSKILLARSAKSDSILCFHSFVNDDLLMHKMRQIREHFGPEKFGKTRLLTSNGQKSWDIAVRRVNFALKTLPPTRIDDLVLGYADEVRDALRNAGTLVETHQLEDIAKLEIFEVRGKTHWNRRVAILSEVNIRYFGNGILPFIKPFLNLDIHRIVFAGSGGSFDENVPPLGVMVPRTFFEISPEGRLSLPLPVDNDLFGLVEKGEVFSGRHISVDSILAETVELVDQLKQRKFQSVDVEVVKIVKLIAEHNLTHSTQVRFACGLIATDFPGSTRPGLSAPDFLGKKKSKQKYAHLLRFLWDVPTPKLWPSNHTRIVTEYFDEEIEKAIQKKDVIALGLLDAEIRVRLAEVARHQKRDLRVSRGIIKSYHDLLRRLSLVGAMPLPIDAPEEPVTVPWLLNVDLIKAIMLQSLSRSATLESGNVVYSTGLNHAQIRGVALANASSAVDFVLSCANRPLHAEDILEIHRRLLSGLLPATHLGSISNFDYAEEDGTTVSSQSFFQAIAQNIHDRTPSASAALNHFIELEHLHGFKDGSGRVAELVAQHTALRALGHPLLFPNRWDIDYILSWRRNGSYSAWLERYLKKMLADSVRFSSWLQETVPWENVQSLGFTTSSDVAFRLPQNLLVMHPYFSSPRRFRLDRESRDWVTVGNPLPRQYNSGSFSSELTIDRRQYQARFALFGGCRGELIRASDN